MSNNPYINNNPNEYFAGYNESIDKNKNHPETVTFDKLCHAVFTQTDDGRQLLKMIEERFIMPGLIDPANSNYKTGVVYYDGFKAAFRTLTNSVKFHNQRIEREMNKA